MTNERRKKVCIGIPCYQNAPAETLEDYMRFAYHCGRRIVEFDFFLAIKPKFEQFRARNSIVTAAMQQDCDYLLMLDDDHVIDWRGTQGPNDQYDFVRRLIQHLEDDPKLGIVGALYYHRGGDCLPVIMKEGKDGGYYYMRDDEIRGELQDVAVTGGGTMLLRMETMLRLPQPIFAPEYQYGTDIQVCRKVWESGHRVACDTSIVLGHVLTRREVVTPETRGRIMMESASGGSDSSSQFDPKWSGNTSYNLYWMDGLEYLGISVDELTMMAERYNDKVGEEFPGKDGDLEAYYESRGKLQLARQLYFHGTKTGLANDSVVLSMFRGGDSLYGLDYCCGSSPVGLELVMRGHRLDFVDLPGSGGYEFLKWRAERRKVGHRCGWEIQGPYDFVLLLDALEHLRDPAQFLVEKIVPAMKADAVLITNYFTLADHENMEHISLDRAAVKTALVNAGVFPINTAVWIRRDLGFMDAKAA